MLAEPFARGQGTSGPAAASCTASFGREIQHSGCLCAADGTRGFCAARSPAAAVWKCAVPGAGGRNLLSWSHQPQQQTPCWQLVIRQPWPTLGLRDMETAGCRVGCPQAWAVSVTAPWPSLWEGGCCRPFAGYCWMREPLPTHSPHAPEPQLSAELLWDSCLSARAMDFWEVHWEAFWEKSPLKTGQHPRGKEEDMRSAQLSQAA